MGSKDRHDENTAWDYGHPRTLTFEKLIGSVSRSRPATSVNVATGVRAFQTVPLTRAVYGTGWDGTVVLEADTHGNWRLDDRAPVVHVPCNTSDSDIIPIESVRHAGEGQTSPRRHKRRDG